MTEEEIIRELKKGGSAASAAGDQLYRMYAKSVLRTIEALVRKFRGQTEDARDLLHDSFFIMLEKIDSDGYKKGSLIHFWIGIGKGLLSNKLRRDRKLQLEEGNSGFADLVEVDPEAKLINMENTAQLDAILGALGERCFEVLKMWMQGYSMAEIMESADISSEAMTRKIKFNCKEKLIELIESHNIDLSQVIYD